MAFTVEDGNGDPDANAYIDVEYFREHQADRGRDTLAFTDEQSEGAIVKATDYIDKRFGKRFRGIRRSHEQGLEWPRLDAFDDDGFLLTSVDQIPRQLKKAAAEYTLIVLRLVDHELLPIPARPFATIDEETGEVVGGISGQIIRNREKVGPLETEQWYSDIRDTGGSNTGVKSSLVEGINIPEYPRADLWIEELINSSMNMRLARGD